MRNLVAETLLLLSLALIALGENLLKKEAFIPDPVAEANVTTNFTFGDMIAFPRLNDLFKHYGIFVGNHSFKEKKPYQDLFHLSGYFEKGRVHIRCYFTTVLGTANKGPFHKHNLHDGNSNWTINSMENMTRIIIALAKDGCESYSLITNNCEHVATYIRYGKFYSQQVEDKIPKKLKKPPTGKRVLRRAALIKLLRGLSSPFR